MPSLKFLVGACCGVLVMIVVLGLMAGGLGLGYTSAAPGGTPQSGKVAGPAASITSKQPRSAADQQLLDLISNAEWSAAAQTLGISVDELSAALNDGRSVDQLAAAHQTTTSQVKDAMLATGQAAVASARQQALATQQQADTLDNTLVPAVAEKLTHANTQTDLSLAGTPSAAAPSKQEQVQQAMAAKQAEPGTPGTENAVVQAEFDAAARLLGLTADQLREQLGSGQLAAAAQAHQVSAPQLRDAMVAAGQSALSRQVAGGQITQSQADDVQASIVTPLAEKLALSVVMPVSATPAP